MWALLVFALVVASTSVAQQVYITVEGPSARPYCTAARVPYPSETGATPEFRFSKFSYTQTETVRTATRVVPTPYASTWGLPYSEASRLLPNLSTASWENYDPAVTKTGSGSGEADWQAAFATSWKSANLTQVERGLYSTTVSPTPVPSSELVLPPPLYFQPHDCYRFPEDFILGVAGSATQIEGAVADEGRTPAVTDILALVTESNAVAAENYYLYKQDIERLAAIGVKYYSFSISWSRILPFVYPGTPVNPMGLKHYEDLIDYAIQKGLTPMVTLLHADTPAIFIDYDILAFADQGGFGGLPSGWDRDDFVDAFVHYGKVVMAHFADRVPYWITINEPQLSCPNGKAVYHVLQAHSRLYHFYKEELHGKGNVAIKQGESPAVPKDPSQPSHREAAQHYTDLYLGTFLDPLALGKDYPDAYKITFRDYVPLNRTDLEYFKGTIDYNAVDIYSAVTVYPITNITSCAANQLFNSLYPSCVGKTEITRNQWNIGTHVDDYVYTTPTYLRTQLNYLWNTWRLPVMITETGFSTPDPPDDWTLDDIRWDLYRTEYYLSYLTEVLHAIWEDNVNVLGVLMWSFLDNWEFGTYSHHFGLQHVNSTTLQRTYKRSFFDVVDFVETRRYKSQRE